MPPTFFSQNWSSLSNLLKSSGVSLGNCYLGQRNLQGSWQEWKVTLVTECTRAGLVRKMIMKWKSSIFNGGAGKRKKGSRRTRSPLVGRERKRERKEEMHFSSQIHGSITKYITMKFKFKH